MPRVVGRQWVLDCVKESTILDESRYPPQRTYYQCFAITSFGDTASQRHSNTLPRLSITVMVQQWWSHLLLVTFHAILGDTRCFSFVFQLGAGQMSTSYSLGHSKACQAYQQQHTSNGICQIEVHAVRITSAPSVSFWEFSGPNLCHGPSRSYALNRDFLFGRSCSKSGTSLSLWAPVLLLLSTTWT